MTEKQKINIIHDSKKRATFAFKTKKGVTEVGFAKLHQNDEDLLTYNLSQRDFTKKWKELGERIAVGRLNCKRPTSSGKFTMKLFGNNGPLEFNEATKKIWKKFLLDALKKRFSSWKK